MDGAPQPLVIFGAGTLALLARAYFARDSGHEIVACTVHREHLGSTRLNGLPTVPFDELEREYPPGKCSVFVAVGYTEMNKRRAEIILRCAALGYHLATLVSSRSHCWDDLQIGLNCLVFDGVVVEPGVEIGDGVIVWSGAQISHDSRIAEHCFIAPNAVLLGDVSVGARSFVGANATVRNGVTIAEDCVIGAGTLVKRDTAPGEIYSGAAAQPVAGKKSWELADL